MLPADAKQETAGQRVVGAVPHGTCLRSVSNQYLASDEIDHPICAPIPRNVTLRRCTVHGGLQMTDGTLTLIDALFQEAYICASIGNTSQDYNSRPGAPRISEICAEQETARHRFLGCASHQHVVGSVNHHPPRLVGSVNHHPPRLVGSVNHQPPRLVGSVNHHQPPLVGSQSKKPCWVVVHRTHQTWWVVVHRTHNRWLVVVQRNEEPC